MRASVAMAVYNGEKYIHQQIDSILSQLTDDDELVISYDISQDSTWDIVNSYRQNDPRVKVLTDEGHGLKNNFENALRNCQGKYIFYSDQDDVWLDHKLETVIRAFESEQATVVIHNAVYTDAELNRYPSTVFEKRKTKTGVARNILMGGYYGCCMAFVSDLREIILPFPENTPSHDMWTGIMGDVYGKVLLLDDVLILYRRHGSNVSGENHRSVRQMILDRCIMISNIISRKRAIKANRSQEHK